MYKGATSGDVKGRSWDDLNAWKQVRDAIESRWPEISHDDLNSCRDDVDAMVEFVSRRVDTPREEIEAVLREHMSAESPSAVQRVGELRKQLPVTTQQCWAQFGQAVDKHPVSTLATVFFAGLVTGLVAAATCCPSHADDSDRDRLRGNW
ncbi:MAG: hypothetical protein ACO1RT_13115 [Planctomycetaceae bacterium]